MRRLLICIVLFISIVAALYKTVPAIRHAIYYRYFVLTKPHIVGGPCGPNCDGFNEYEEVPDKVDTIPGFLTNDTNRIRISGVIYDKEGRPAENVLLYVFQANTSGIYPKMGDEQGAARLNGYLRGWMKTGADGRYEFFSNRPGSYPGTTRMAHIHCVIKEEDLNAYTLPDFVFPEDSNLTAKARSTTQNENGGLVILSGRDSSGISFYRRDMYLGRNVVNYPDK